MGSIEHYFERIEQNLDAPPLEHGLVQVVTWTVHVFRLVLDVLSTLLGLEKDIVSRVRALEEDAEASESSRPPTPAVTDLLFFSFFLSLTSVL